MVGRMDARTQRCGRHRPTHGAPTHRLVCARRLRPRVDFESVGVCSLRSPTRPPSPPTTKPYVAAPTTPSLNRDGQGIFRPFRTTGPARGPCGARTPLAHCRSGPAAAALAGQCRRPSRRRRARGAASPLERRHSAAGAQNRACWLATDPVGGFLTRAATPQQSGRARRPANHWPRCRQGGVTTGQRLSHTSEGVGGG